MALSSNQSPNHEFSLDVFLRIAKDFLNESSIKVIFELGARDCNETLAFHELLPTATIYAFECNPDTLPLCRLNIQFSPNIHLIEKAVTDHEGTVTFYPIDREKTVTTWEDGNPGASSLLQATGKYPVETYVQRQILVEATTLESVMIRNNIDRIDLLWMDIQGGELMALQGLGDRIHNVNVIHTEVEFFQIYERQPVFADIKKYLNKTGFLFVAFTTYGQYSADAVFVNKRIIRRLGPLLKYRLVDKLTPFIYSVGNKYAKLRKKGFAFLRRPRRRFDILKRMMAFDRRTWYLNGYRELLRVQRALFTGCGESGIPLDIVITAVAKDAEVLPYAIRSVRANVRHPIGEIFVIAPKSEQIISVCSTEQCTYVDEDSVLPITLKDIDYSVDGADRSGWLFQQLLKLGADEICRREYFLVIDADTVLIGPHRFVSHGRALLLYSDEYHRPYFDAYSRLLGEEVRSCVSFVTHYMVFHRPKLKALKKRIEEKNDMPWYSAIAHNVDKTQASGFSEYETYGNYVFANFRDSVKLEYAFNGALHRRQLRNLYEIAGDKKKQWRSISFHSYIKGAHGHG